MKSYSFIPTNPNHLPQSWMGKIIFNAQEQSYFLVPLVVKPLFYPQPLSRHVSKVVLHIGNARWVKNDDTRGQMSLQWLVKHSKAW